MNAYLRGLVAASLIALCGGASAQWRFVKQIDKFTGSNESHVVLKSRNSQPVGVNSQATTVELIIFESPGPTSFKAALMFSAHSMPVAASYNGGFCPGSYSCDVLIKMDGAEIVQVPIVESGQGDRAFVYLRVPNDEFLKTLLGAKKIEMRATFFRQGSGTFTFNSNGKNPLTQ